MEMELQAFDGGGGAPGVRMRKPYTMTKVRACRQAAGASAAACSA